MSYARRNAIKGESAAAQVARDKRAAIMSRAHAAREAGLTTEATASSTQRYNQLLAKIREVIELDEAENAYQTVFCSASLTELNTKDANDVLLKALRKHQQAAINIWFDKIGLDKKFDISRAVLNGKGPLIIQKPELEDESERRKILCNVGVLLANTTKHG